NNTSLAEGGGAARNRCPNGYGAGASGCQRRGPRATACTHRHLPFHHTRKLLQHMCSLPFILAHPQPLAQEIHQTLREQIKNIPPALPFEGHSYDAKMDFEIAKMQTNTVRA